MQFENVHKYVNAGLQINKTKLRYHVFKLGYVFVCGSTFLMMFTFLTAFLSPNKTIVIDINMMGEMHLELLLIFVCIPITIYIMWESKYKILPKIKEGLL